MASDDIFRIIAGAGAFAMLAISGDHRRRARASGPRPRRTDESLSLRAIRAATAGPLMLGFLLYLAHPPWMAWASVPLPSVARWLGAGMLAAAVPLVWSLFRHLGTNVTETVLVSEDAALVTSGPYRWVRHPLYTTVLLAWSGIALLAANAFIGAFTVLYGVAVAVRIVPEEESRLAEAFGEEWERYRRRTGALIPRIGRTPPTVDDA